MSDSPQQENKPLLPPKDGEKAQSKQKQMPKHQDTPTKLPILLKLIIVLAIIALAAFAWVVSKQLLAKPDMQDSQDQASLASPDTATSEPISILPLEPGGVTILTKQPEPQDQTALAPSAPIAQGADIASGFAMDVGAADSYLELSQKFAELTEINGAENFQRLEPRAILRETITGLEARLLIGPFATSELALEACNALILPEDTPCTAETFQGDLIARE